MIAVRTSGLFDCLVGLLGSCRTLPCETLKLAPPLPFQSLPEAVGVFLVFRLKTIVFSLFFSVVFSSFSFPPPFKTPKRGKGDPQAPFLFCLLRCR